MDVTCNACWNSRGELLATWYDCPYYGAMSALDVLIRVIIAAALGGLIGIEREIREHTAGFRTHILVSVGAAAFTIASIYGVEGTDIDPNRISSGIVTGMGFLGAGAIIRYGVSVRGLTTAASLWAVAAVGLLSGQGFYEAAAITAGVVIASLYLLRLVEDRVIYRLSGHVVKARVRFTDSGYAPLTRLTSRLGEMRVTIKEIALIDGESNDDTVHLSLRLPRHLNEKEFLALVLDMKEVHSVEFD